MKTNRYALRKANNVLKLVEKMNTTSVISSPTNNQLCNENTDPTNTLNLNSIDNNMDITQNILDNPFDFKTLVGSFASNQVVERPLVVISHIPDTTNQSLGNGGLNTSITQQQQQHHQPLIGFCTNSPFYPPKISTMENMSILETLNSSPINKTKLPTTITISNINTNVKLQLDQSPVVTHTNIGNSNKLTMNLDEDTSPFISNTLPTTPIKSPPPCTTTPPSSPLLPTQPIKLKDNTNKYHMSQIPGPSKETKLDDLLPQQDNLTTDSFDLEALSDLDQSAIIHLLSPGKTQNFKRTKQHESRNQDKQPMNGISKSKQTLQENPATAKTQTQNQATKKKRRKSTSF